MLSPRAIKEKPAAVMAPIADIIHDASMVRNWANSACSGVKGAGMRVAH